MKTVTRLGSENHFDLGAYKLTVGHRIQQIVICHLNHKLLDGIKAATRYPYADALFFRKCTLAICKVFISKLSNYMSMIQKNCRIKIDLYSEFDFFVHIF